MREVKLKKLGMFTKWFLSPGFRYIYAGFVEMYFAKTLNTFVRDIKYKVRGYLNVGGGEEMYELLYIIGGGSSRQLRR
jgi:hypothetical protein